MFYYKIDEAQIRFCYLRARVDLGKPIHHHVIKGDISPTFLPQVLGLQGEENIFLYHLSDICVVSEVHGRALASCN